MTPPDDTDIARLTQRLDHLEDVRAIEQLKYRYAALCDDGYDADGIASCFTEDGRWVVDGEGATLDGREAIRQHFAQLSHRIPWGLHFVTAPQIRIDEDGRTATGTFYLLCLCTIASSDDSDEKDAVFLTITYFDHFVKQGDSWLFAELSGQTHQVSDWRQGWVAQPFR